MCEYLVNNARCDMITQDIFCEQHAMKIIKNPKLLNSTEYSKIQILNRVLEDYNEPRIIRIKDFPHLIMMQSCKCKCKKFLTYNNAYLSKIDITLKLTLDNAFFTCKRCYLKLKERKITHLSFD